MEVKLRHNWEVEGVCKTVSEEEIKSGCRDFFFSSRRRHTRCSRDWSSDVCSSDLQRWLVTGGTLGLLDGLSGFLEPSLAPVMTSVITFSMLKGLLPGLAIGFFSQRVQDRKSVV